MPFRLSFPLHFGAKKRRASAAEAAEIRLALIALLVRLGIVSYLGTFDVSTDICLVSCCLCFAVGSFISLGAWDFIGNKEAGGAYCYMFLFIYPRSDNERRCRSDRWPRCRRSRWRTGVPILINT